MTILCSKTFIWPHPIETLLSGQKIIRLKELARINAEFGNEVPLIANITSVDDLDRLDLRNVVLKRTYSEFGEHVFIGENINKERLANMMDQNHEHWSQMPAHYQPVWFVQPLLPTMVEKLELRLVCVNRYPLYGIPMESGIGGRPHLVKKMIWPAPLDNVL